ncbi:hypothetical protein CEXT_623831 [Caerostris extrusa]|uniref:Uncharacterized protein n=1 Tax=Caerostris extrusa TaxID=172846 RepID=A0AAV4RLW8_CAEEX|nr:hypothetical protein CEXT_623831 [Caerostris extrusa]
MFLKRTFSFRKGCDGGRKEGREEDRAPLADRQLEFENLIKEVETQVFQRMDQKAALTDIVKDQESHKKLLEDEERMRQLTRTKLQGMAQAAQAVLGVATPSEDSRSGHWEFLEKMSTLLLDPEGESGSRTVKIYILAMHKWNSTTVHEESSAGDQERDGLDRFVPSLDLLDSLDMLSIKFVVLQFQYRVNRKWPSAQ